MITEKNYQRRKRAVKAAIQLSTKEDASLKLSEDAQVALNAWLYNDISFSDLKKRVTSEIIKHLKDYEDR